MDKNITIKTNEKSNEESFINLNKIYSQDSRPSHLIRKINHSTGQYELFEGITTVCNLVSDFTPFYDILSKILPGDCYSLLPLSSFHMTIASIHTRNRFPSCDKYNQYLKNNFDALAQVKSYYESLDRSFKFEMKINHIPQKLDTKSALGIELVGTEETEKILLEWQTITKEKFGITRPLPKWHMTFAYPTKRILTKEEQQEIISFLKSLTNTVFVFEKPRLCFFNSMTEFKTI